MGFILPPKSTPATIADINSRLDTLIAQTDGIEALLASIGAGTPTIAPKLDTLTGAQVGIEYAHHETHDGNYYRCGGNWATLAAATNYDVRVDVAAGKELHFNFEMEGSTESGYSLLEFGTTTSSTGGVAQTIICKNRQRKGTPTATVTADVTTTVGNAAILAVKRVGSGKTSGGDVGTDEEWILAKSKSYIVRFTNYANPGTLTGYWKISWYEE
jgi:hypothetical protein